MVYDDFLPVLFSNTYIGKADESSEFVWLFSDKIEGLDVFPEWVQADDFWLHAEELCEFPLLWIIPNPSWL